MCLEAAWEKGFEVFIANIKESLNPVPPDLKKPFNVRERSVKEIVDSLPKSQRKKRTFPPKSFLTIHLKTNFLRRTNALPPHQGDKKAPNLKGLA
ncbi:hypothetical protein HpNP113_13130 [Helicobacter pylori]